MLCFGFKIDIICYGFDVVVEMVVVFVVVLIVFKGVDCVYFVCFLCSVEQFFNFVNNYWGKYSDSMVGVVCLFYCLYLGFNDEFFWGVIWLLVVIGNVWYSQYFVKNVYFLGGVM